LHRLFEQGELPLDSLAAIAREPGIAPLVPAGLFSCPGSITSRRYSFTPRTNYQAVSSNK
jgi:hypothetical protein